MKRMELVVVVEAPKKSPIAVVLGRWADWMRLSDRQHTDGSGHPQDTKEFMALGETVDCMINDLPRIQWWAVRRAHGLCTVWNFPNAEWHVVFEDALATLEPKMRKAVATRRYFD